MKKVLTGIIAAGVCVSLYFLFTSPVRPLFWEAGARGMFGFSQSTDVSMTHLTGETATSRHSVAGTINMRVFHADEDLVKVGIQLSPVTVTAGGKRIPGLEKIFAAFFLAELSPEGKFLRFHFDPSVSKEDSRGVIYLLQSFQGIIRPGRFSSWEDMESDGIGEYRSAYRATRRYVVKEKKAYLRVTGAGFDSGFGRDVGAVIGENSKLVLHYGGSALWFRAARGAETVSLLVKGNKTASFSVVSSLNLVEFNPDTGLDIWKEEHTFNELASLWAKEQRREGSFWKDLEAESLRTKYAGKSLGELLTNFTVTGKIIPWDAITAMKEFFLVNPGECRRVPGMLRGGSLNDIQQAALIHVLELTGHSEAQKTLSAIFNDGSHTMMNRMRSIIALSGVASPTDESIENLIALAGSRESAGARELSNTAILGIGAISGSQPALAGDEDAERRRNRIKEHLKKELTSGSGDADKTAVVLSAIGNSLDESLAGTVMSFIDDGNDRVRASAARALVAVGGEKDRKALIDRLGEEKNAEVKFAAFNALGEKPPMDSAVRHITGAIGSESDARVRNAMLKYLVKNRDEFPDIRKTLLNLNATERDAANRRLIHQGLYSKQGPLGN